MAKKKEDINQYASVKNNIADCFFSKLSKQFGDAEFEQMLDSRGDLSRKVHFIAKTIVEKANFFLNRFPFAPYYEVGCPLYAELFGKIPSTIVVTFTSSTDGSTLNERSCEKLNLPKSSSGNTIDIVATFLNYKKRYGTDVYIVPTGACMTAFFEHGMIVQADMECGVSDLEVYYNPDEVSCLNEVFSLTEVIANDKKSKTIEYIVSSPNGGYYTKDLEVSSIGSDASIEENYNDDLPDKQIVEFLNSDASGIAVFHGEPGTGKTTYIRNLISRISKNFIYLNKDCLLRLGESSMVNLLIDNRDSIIVLEDCEEIISKDNGRSTCLTNLLNMSDGILGDSLKFKFICTFNVATSEIDPAIMRKGRMRVKYEFKKLAVEKTRRLLKKLYPKGDGANVEDFLNAKEMTLADIYNFKIDNGSKAKNSNAIGF